MSERTDCLWVDGLPADSVPADDRGLNLADGAFETLRIDAGQVALLDSHRERLAMGLALLAFSDPQTHAESALALAIGALATALPNMSGSLRVTVTRGSGPRGYAPPQNPNIRVISRFVEGLPALSEPARLLISPVCWAEQSQFAGAKLLARTEQVVALHAARQAGFDDALMTSADGRCISTASGNLFFRRGRDLLTPRLSTCGISGTRRRAIIEHWAQALDYRVSEVDLDAAQLDEMDEAFSCNAVQGVRAIASIGAVATADHSAAEALAPHIHREYRR